VENAALIDESWLAGVSTIGLSSGASVPEVLVREVMDWLAAHGYDDVQEISETEERLTFALPQELRRELRAKS
ncbi:MAG TPA: 4-hydroxy-3-methylbut-2-enyl diphosphate reductase, partial [Jatrophihabitans sp.]|nr:4-hydroxy-3-methylbut-2-enyl diphosphate reductase [Jatrophihabitans sp.]